MISPRSLILSSAEWFYFALYYYFFRQNIVVESIHCVHFCIVCVNQFFSSLSTFMIENLFNPFNLALPLGSNQIPTFAFYAESSF